MRAVFVALASLFVLIPTAAAGQASIITSPDTGREGRDRVSVQAAVGPTATLIGGGSVLSGAFGYSPASRLELLVNIERDHVPFRLDGSATRGGTLTFVSGELRVSLLPSERVSPFAIVGAGGGVSRPNVNALFPEPVRNDLRVLYVGGGVRVPLRHGLSLVGDARWMLGLEGYDGVLAVWPVRIGLAWRF